MSEERRRVLLSECTLLHVEAQIARSPKVIVPVGSTEQHGPHAPFGRYLDQIDDATVRFVEHVEQMFEALPERTQ